MPRAANVYRAVPGHPGVAANPTNTRFVVRWTRKGRERSRYFDTLKEAERFRADNNLGRSGAWARDPVKRERLLKNLQKAPLQFGRAHRVIHGGEAAVTEHELTAKEQSVYDAIAQDLPVSGPDGEPPRHDRLVVRQLAESLVRRDRITAYERENGLLSENGKVRPATELGLELDSRILRLCTELALTPRSRATLGLELAVGAAAAHVAQGFEMLDGRNPIEIDSGTRRAAARALLGIGDQSTADVIDADAIDFDD
jgi:hypothetical protein